MKKKKNVAASLLHIPLDLENIGYQFRTIDDTRDWIPKEDGGWSNEEWNETRFAKIIISDKTASTSLRGLENETLSIQDKIDWDTLINGYLICLIRNPIDKYKSAIKEKYIEHFSLAEGNQLEDFSAASIPTFVEKSSPSWNFLL